MIEVSFFVGYLIAGLIFGQMYINADFDLEEFLFFRFTALFVWPIYAGALLAMYLAINAGYVEIDKDE